MPLAGFEPTIPVFKRAKIFHALDRAATVIGSSKIPHFLDNRLTDGGEVVSLTRRPPFTPQEDSWGEFPLEAESTPGS
jgi:hypothetical protein